MLSALSGVIFSSKPLVRGMFCRQHSVLSECCQRCQEYGIGPIHPEWGFRHPRMGVTEPCSAVGPSVRAGCAPSTARTPARRANGKTEGPRAAHRYDMGMTAEYPAADAPALLKLAREDAGLAGISVYIDRMASTAVGPV